MELLLGSKNATDSVHSGDRSRIGTERMFIRSDSFVKIVQKFRKAT